MWRGEWLSGQQAVFFDSVNFLKVTVCAQGPQDTTGSVDLHILPPPPHPHSRTSQCSENMPRAFFFAHLLSWSPLCQGCPSCFSLNAYSCSKTKLKFCLLHEHFFYPSYGDNCTPMSDFPALGVSYPVPQNVMLFCADFCFCLSCKIRCSSRAGNPVFLILSSCTA